MIVLKTNLEIDSIDRSAKILSSILRRLIDETKPGTTTLHLNNLAESLCLDKGALPGFKNYNGFPYSLCCSKNNAVVHGFPNNVPLVEGDILSLDFGVRYKGWYSDAAVTIPVGNVSKKASELIRATFECLHRGIQAAQPFGRLGDISEAIESTSKAHGFDVLDCFTGHGVGKDLHEDPQIYNRGKKGEGYIIKPGMVIAIEPIVFYGDREIIYKSNKWEAYLSDDSLSAHFEHTVLITENGPEVLTSLI